MHRHQTLLLSCALSLLAGCASTPFGTSQQRSSSSPPSSSPPSIEPQAASGVVAGTANASASEAAVPLRTVQIDTPDLRTIDLTLHADDLWDRIRTGFAIPDMNSPLVVEQQAWYLSHQDFLQRAVERSSLYLYHVVEELHKRGMPTELALLPFIESAYNPMAYSRAHASGMWQFIPTTGRNYKLQQDWWRDERRDVVASTDAALNYLETLYEMHGDWTLALASYNWGEGAVKRAIERNAAADRPTDYLSLNMPDETRNYYPKLQALKNIIANPDAFGVVLPHIDNEPYFVSIPSTRNIDVRTAARLADMPLEDFKALNSSFNRPMISGSADITLLLPADRVAVFQRNMKGNVEPLSTWVAYTAKRGDRLDRIAAKFGMSVASLCDANSISSRSRLRPGQGLLVQSRNASASNVVAPPARPSPAIQQQIVRVNFTPESEPHRGPTPYVVRKGDSLYTIAKHFSISVDALRTQNRLTSTSLAPGQKILIPVTLLANSQSAAASTHTH